MYPPASRVFTTFRPSDSALDAEEEVEVQIYRLLCLLGAALLPVFGFLYEALARETFHPMGPRFFIAGLFACLFVASYLSGRVRRQYAWWLRGILYVMMGWVVLFTAQNQFPGDFTLGLLATYAVLVLVVGLGARRLSPVLWFVGFGVVSTGIGFLLESAPQTSPLITISSMGTLGLIEVITIQGWIAARREIKRRSDAMEAAADGMAILDSTGTYVHVNQAHAEIYGYSSPEAFLGNEWAMCYGVREQRRFEENIMPRLYEEGHWRGEATGKRPEGTTFPQSLTLTVLEDGGIICVVQDITDQKEREQKLIEAKEEAQKASRMKDAFLANMSHEIRTPLTSIIGFAEAIAEEAEGSGGVVGQFATTIEKSGLRLLETLDAVLQLSKLEAGEMNLSLERIDLFKEAKQTAKELRPKARDSGLELHVNGQAPTCAWADEGEVQIVLRNLLSNAIKYTEPGGEIWIKTWAENGSAFLEVKDTGIGMDSGRVEELFEPFQQESEGMDRAYEGTGLGLAVTKLAVEQMGGTVEVETEKGVGSRFTVCVPTADSPGRRSKS